MRQPVSASVVCMLILLTVGCSRARTIEISSSDAGGVKKGDAVIMAGLTIGRVSTLKVLRGSALITAAITEQDALPSNREVAFLVTECGARGYLEGHEIGPVRSSSPQQYYRGTTSLIELAMWQGRATLEGWWRGAVGR